MANPTSNPQSTSPLGDGAPSGRPPTPAATVLVCRDSPSGLAVLLTHRNSKTAFGGMWAFPGGRVDKADYPAGGDDSPAHLFTASINAAVREAKEEVDVDLAADSLVPYAHFAPPVEAPRRFLTWFFVAPDPGGRAGEVSLAADELSDHVWLTPAAALARQADGEMGLAPPTFMALFKLRAHSGVEDLLDFARSNDPIHHLTVFREENNCRYVLWQGDTAYPDGDLNDKGGRHRIEMRDAGWTAMVDYE